jgi:hypothetical protein
VAATVGTSELSLGAEVGFDNTSAYIITSKLPSIVNVKVATPFSSSLNRSYHVVT